MGLAPLEIHQDPNHARNYGLLVWEGHSQYSVLEEYCITVVCVVQLGEDSEIPGHQRLGVANEEDVREWTCYWAAYPSTMEQENRIRTTRRHGNKVPRLVAEAMFSRFAGAYYRE
jgi:hypothetical protein